MSNDSKHFKNRKIKPLARGHLLPTPQTLTIWETSLHKSHSQFDGGIRDSYAVSFFDGGLVTKAKQRGCHIVLCCFGIWWLLWCEEWPPLLVIRVTGMVALTLTKPRPRWILMVASLSPSTLISVPRPMSSSGLLPPPNAAIAPPLRTMLLVSSFSAFSPSLFPSSLYPLDLFLSPFLYLFFKKNYVTNNCQLCLNSMILWSRVQIPI